METRFFDLGDLGGLYVAICFRKVSIAKSEMNKTTQEMRGREDKGREKYGVEMED